MMDEEEAKKMMEGDGAEGAAEMNEAAMEGSKYM